MSPPPANSALPVQVDAPLEKLPPEIRREILSTLKLEELSCMIRASPVFYQQYMQGPIYFLGTCLENTLGNVLIDAFVVSQSGSHSFRRQRSEDTISYILELYQGSREGTHSVARSALCSDDHILEILNFYCRVIRPIARLYVTWSLDNLADESQVSYVHGPLSKVEETRILRALYRFQLCCQIFEALDNLSEFIYLFEPWEAEEVMCIYAFADGIYNGPVPQIKPRINYLYGSLRSENRREYRACPHIRG